MELLTLIIFSFSLFVVIISVPFHGRIIGGSTVEPNEFRYIASVQIDTHYHHGHYCGASILNKKWLVTAAHCIWNLEPINVTILAGSTNLDNGGTLHRISQLVPHPQFNTTTLWNDIALIKIEDEFKETQIQTIGIGDVGNNEDGTILGWGSTTDEDVSNNLQSLEMKTVSPEDCSVLAEGSIRNQFLPRGSGQVCVFGGKDVGVCHGDSGGPLVHNGQLVGVASYTLSVWCAEGFPDVYTKAVFYLDWIKEVLEKNE